MKPSQSLSIIIVNYNSCELLKGCLQSIQETCRDVDPEILVVDNDSKDSSVEMVRETFPSAEIIASPVNLGYARAINQASEITTGQYILILNADIIIKPKAIQSLLSFMEKHPGCGIAGPKLLYPDGRLQLSCRTFYTLKTILFRRTFIGQMFPKSNTLKDHLMSEWDHNCEKDVDWLVGAALIVRRDAIDQVGSMDERYFLYLEDVDWSYRMNIAGWKVCYVPQAEVIHYYRQGSRSESGFTRDVFIHLVSMLRYYDKWDKMLYILKKTLNILRRPAFMLLDLAGILFSFWIAFNIRELIGITESEPSCPISAYHKPVFIFSGITILTYYLRGLYENKRTWLWVDRFFLAAKSTLISSFIMLIVLFLFSINYEAGFVYSKIILISFAVTAMLAAAIIHQFTYFISKWLWRKRFNLKRLLIVGHDQTAMNIKEELSKTPGMGYDLAGFISPENDLANLAGFRMAGNIQELIEICDRERIQEVVFVNIDKYYKNIIFPFIRCRKKMIDVKIISDDFGAEAIDSRIKDFAGFPSLDFECMPSYYIGSCLKRLTDITIALAGLIILSPLILFILLRLKFEDGEAFFIQKRLGKNGKEFFLYKFRTMIPDAENHKEHLDNMATDGLLFKVRNDPRATRFGRFLRKYNLDEIPQFINVLKGEMSLIGPRPPLPGEVAQYEDWHKARLEVKPGITGLWQVDKKRKWKFDEMVKLDIHYILNWSLLLDFKILLRTPGAILRGTGVRL